MPRPFVPKPGQTDFTNARWVPVVNCVVKCGDLILIVRRSSGVRIYPGSWNGIGGYLDDDKSLEEKVHEELFEELGIVASDVVSIKLGEIFDLEDSKYGKTFVMHPILVEAKTDKVTLDWEADEFRWVTVEEARKTQELVPGFRKVLDSFFL